MDQKSNMQMDSITRAKCVCECVSVCVREREVGVKQKKWAGATDGKCACQIQKREIGSHPSLSLSLFLSYFVEKVLLLSYQKHKKVERKTKYRLSFGEEQERRQQQQQQQHNPFPINQFGFWSSALSLFLSREKTKNKC